MKLGILTALGILFLSSCHNCGATPESFTEVCQRLNRQDIDRHLERENPVVIYSIP